MTSRYSPWESRTAISREAMRTTSCGAISNFASLDDSEVIRSQGPLRRGASLLLLFTLRSLCDGVRTVVEALMLYAPVLRYDAAVSPLSNPAGLADSTEAPIFE